MLAAVMMPGLLSARKAPSPVQRVEPLSWWVGMNTPLQLMIYGDDLSSYDVEILPAGSGVGVTAVHKADNPDYLFVDVAIADDASAGDYTLRLSSGKRRFDIPYTIAERREGSAARKSFSTADMVYLIMPDRFANGDESNDSTADTSEKADRSDMGGRHGGDLPVDHDDGVAHEPARDAGDQHAEGVGQPVDRVRISRIGQGGHGGEHARAYLILRRRPQCSRARKANPFGLPAFSADQRLCS